MTILVTLLIVYVVAACAICGAALVIGGTAERQAAASLLLAAAATQIAALAGPRWHGPEYGVMLVDAIFAVALLNIALKSERFWPLWATASQLIGTLTHVAAILHPIGKRLYVLTQSFWVVPILVAIAIGVRSERRGSARPR